VAWEVVRQYPKEHQHEHQSVIVMPGCGFANPPTKTKEFTQWEKNKYIKMKIGLAFLTVGFILQISANIVQLFQNKDIQNSTSAMHSSANPTSKIEAGFAPVSSTKNSATKTSIPKSAKPTPAK